MISSAATQAANLPPLLHGVPSMTKCSGGRTWKRGVCASGNVLYEMYKKMYFLLKEKQESPITALYRKLFMCFLEGGAVICQLQKLS